MSHYLLAPAAAFLPDKMNMRSAQSWTSDHLLRQRSRPPPASLSGADLRDFSTPPSASMLTRPHSSISLRPRRPALAAVRAHLRPRGRRALPAALRRRAVLQRGHAQEVARVRERPPADLRGHVPVFCAEALTQPLRRKLLSARRFVGPSVLPGQERRRILCAITFGTPVGKQKHRPTQQSSTTCQLS